jgi:hypothetical protein
MIRKVTGFAAMLMVLVALLWGDAAPLSGREEKKLSDEERKTLAKQAAELNAQTMKFDRPALYQGSSETRSFSPAISLASIRVWV